MDAYNIFAEASKISKFGFNTTEEAISKFFLASETWRKEKEYFLAGLCLQRVYSSFREETDRYQLAVNSIHSDYLQALKNAKTDSLESLATLHKLIQFLRELLFVVEDRPALESDIDKYKQELAQRLIDHYSNSENKENYLVKGINLITNYRGKWQTKFPKFEVDSGIESFSSSHTEMSISGAFDLLISLGDYEGANKIVSICPRAFDTPALKGWKSVVKAYLDKKQSAKYFKEAAEYFASDTYDEDVSRKRGHWSSKNIDTWAKYFESMSFLAKAISDPTKAIDYISKAAKLAENENSGGWSEPQVMRYRSFIHALNSLISESDDDSLHSSKVLFKQSLFFRGSTSEDQLLEDFISAVEELLKTYKSSPDSAILQGEKLSVVFDILSKMTIVDKSVGSVVRPAVGKKLIRLIQNPPSYSWIYRVFESIKDEETLTKIFFKLLQSLIPAYAQVRHGPIEWGKDVAVVSSNENGKNILNIYQLKCGDINKAVWSKAKDEMEEIFDVPLSDFQIKVKIDHVAGILLCNGHANLYAEPVIQGWMKNQKEKLGRDVRFEHLDDLVNWIINKRLTSELRKILDDLNIKIS